VCVCARTRVRACMRVCMRACLCVCVHMRVSCLAGPKEAGGLARLTKPKVLPTRPWCLAMLLLGWIARGHCSGGGSLCPPHGWWLGG